MPGGLSGFKEHRVVQRRRKYLLLLIISIFGIIIYCGVLPMAIWMVLTSRWCRRFYTAERAGYESMLGFLTQRYSRRAYLWEIVVFFKKFFAAAIPIYFASSKVTQSTEEVRHVFDHRRGPIVEVQDADIITTTEKREERREYHRDELAKEGDIERMERLFHKFAMFKETPPVKRWGPYLLHSTFILTTDGFHFANLYCFVAAARGLCCAD